MFDAGASMSPALSAARSDKILIQENTDGRLETDHNFKTFDQRRGSEVPRTTFRPNIVSAIKSLHYEHRKRELTKIANEN